MFTESPVTSKMSAAAKMSMYGFPKPSSHKKPSPSARTFSAPVRRDAVAKIIPPVASRKRKTRPRIRKHSAAENSNARFPPPNKTPIRGRPPPVPPLPSPKRATAAARRASKTSPETGPTAPVMDSVFFPPVPSCRGRKIASNIHPPKNGRCAKTANAPNRRFKFSAGKTAALPQPTTTSGRPSRSSQPRESGTVFSKTSADKTSPSARESPSACARIPASPFVMEKIRIRQL